MLTIIDIGVRLIEAYIKISHKMGSLQAEMTAISESKFPEYTDIDVYATWDPGLEFDCHLINLKQAMGSEGHKEMEQRKSRHLNEVVSERERIKRIRDALLNHIEALWGINAGKEGDNA